MPSGIDFLIQRGERLAQGLRPATLKYAGATIPCSIGNLDYVQTLEEGGFKSLQNITAKILRSDLAPPMIAAGFHAGQAVTLADLTSGDIFNLVIGNNNSTQGLVIILNLEKPAG